MPPIAYLGPQQLTDTELTEIARFLADHALTRSDRPAPVGISYTYALLDDLLRARTALAEHDARIVWGVRHVEVANTVYEFDTEQHARNAVKYDTAHHRLVRRVDASAWEDQT